MNFNRPGSFLRNITSSNFLRENVTINTNDVPSNLGAYNLSRPSVGSVVTKGIFNYGGLVLSLAGIGLVSTGGQIAKNATQGVKIASNGLSGALKTANSAKNVNELSKSISVVFRAGKAVADAKKAKDTAEIITKVGIGCMAVGGAVEAVRATLPTLVNNSRITRRFRR